MTKTQCKKARRLYRDNGCAALNWLPHGLAMDMVLDQLIDPAADTLEHHPMRQQIENALLWTLYHNQGGSSPIGQPIRKLLGIGQYDRLTDEQIASAKEFGEGESCATTPPQAI